jgi:hypothetical protein
VTDPERFQVLYEVGLLGITQAELQAIVMMVDDLAQVPKRPSW